MYYESIYIIFMIDIEHVKMIFLRKFISKDYNYFFKLVVKFRLMQILIRLAPTVLSAELSFSYLLPVAL